MRTEQKEALNLVTARFFKGLGDPIRLKILEYLGDEEKAVSEIDPRIHDVKWVVAMGSYIEAIIAT